MGLESQGQQVKTFSLTRVATGEYSLSFKVPQPGGAATTPVSFMVILAPIHPPFIYIISP
jgi:hypothetical protein